MEKAVYVPQQVMQMATYITDVHLPVMIAIKMKPEAEIANENAK